MNLVLVRTQVVSFNMNVEKQFIEENDLLYLLQRDFFMKSKLVEPIEDVRYRKQCIEEIDGDLLDWLRETASECRTWTDPPNTYHSPHDHPYSHRVLAVSGTITFTVAGRDYELTAGDALDLPSGVRHEATTTNQSPTEYWLIQP